MFQMTSLGPPASGENIIKQPNKRMFFNSGQVLLLRSFGLSSLVFFGLQVDSFLPGVGNRIGALLISTQQRLVR